MVFSTTVPGWSAGVESRARTDILEDILGYFVLLEHHSDRDIKYRIRISDISRFCSKWVDLPTGYSDISRFCSKWVDSPTGYSDILRFCYMYRFLVLVQYLRPRSLYFKRYPWIMTLLQDIWRIFGAKTSDIVSHDKSLIIGYSGIFNPGYPRGTYCRCGLRYRACQ